MHPFVEGDKDCFNFPFPFLVSDRLDNGSPPIFWIVCPSHLASLFQSINNSCYCTGGQASQLSKPASRHGSILSDKIQAFMVSNVKTKYICYTLVEHYCFSRHFSTLLNNSLNYLFSLVHA